MPDQSDITPADPGHGATPDPVRKDRMSDSSTISIAEYNRVKDESVRRKELIRRLKEENAALTQQVETLSAENEEMAGTLEEAAGALEGADGEMAERIAAIEAERDEWKAKFEAAPSEHLAELNAYREKDRLAARDKSLAEVAESLGIDPAKLGDVKLLARLGDDAELPDGDTLRTTLAEVVKTRDWLKVQPKAKAAETAAKGAEGDVVAQNGTTDPAGPQTSPGGELSRMGILLSSKGSGPGTVRGLPETPQVRPSVEQIVNQRFQAGGRSLDKPMRL